jgi:hypothetical protein
MITTGTNATYYLEDEEYESLKLEAKIITRIIVRIILRNDTIKFNISPFGNNFLVSLLSFLNHLMKTNPVYK